jgi:aminoglycoside phosphotransferase (APT) family kinase protein
VPDIDQRDPAEVAGALSAWLNSRLPAGAEPEVYEVEAPATNGFSNETILCRARWQADGGPVERRLVFRVAPTKHLLFLDAHFDTQYRVMKTLQDAGSKVPLPPLGLYEEDPRWLGVPFFTMDHVEGRVPADNLPYTMDGWVLEASDAERETMWWSGLEAMAEVHRTDWRALGLEWLVPGGRDACGLSHQLAYYRAFLDWSAGDRPQPTTEAAWRWLVDNRPDESGDPVLCWGDARLGNVIWEDFRPSAVLDWEMATLAQPELDLGWWLYFDRQFSEGLNVARPTGFPTREESIERYSELLGRPMRNVEYYEVFSGFRFAVIMVRLADLLVNSDLLPMDSDMGTNNLATQFTAQLLGLPAPS